MSVCFQCRRRRPDDGVTLAAMVKRMFDGRHPWASMAVVASYLVSSQFRQDLRRVFASAAMWRILAILARTRPALSVNTMASLSTRPMTGIMNSRRCCPHCARPSRRWRGRIETVVEQIHNAKVGPWPRPNFISRRLPSERSASPIPTVVVSICRPRLQRPGTRRRSTVPA